MVFAGDLFPISGEQLRSWLRSQAQGLFTTFTTGAEALEWLRSEGASIRTQDFYEIRRSVLTEMEHAREIQSFDYNQLIPAAWHTDDHGWELSRNYLYVVRVDGVDPDTYDIVTKYLSVASDRQLTQADVFDQLGGMVEGQEDFYGIMIESYSLEKALVLPGVFS